LSVAELELSLYIINYSFLNILFISRSWGFLVNPLKV